MKRQAIIVSALAALLAPNAGRAAVITQWTFNSSPSDNAPNTGTAGPEIGAGTVSLLGVNGSFAGIPAIRLGSIASPLLTRPAAPSPPLPLRRGRP